ncbi:MAG TPA: S8 family serine peptidase [Caulobacteraceae bacterium]|nr:S8 family serine peptidase [Caulobacteraceae bacterium]
MRLLAHISGWVAACALVLAGGTALANAAEPTDPGREVLVMLRLPPEHASPNADFGGGYGGGADQNARRRIADRLARENGLTVADNWPMPLVGVDCFVFVAPPGKSTVEMAEHLSHDPAVAWSQAMNLYRGQGVVAPQGRLFLAQPAAKEWRLALLHTVSTGRNVRVAVVDSMVDREHPDLIGQVAVSQNFAAGHGETPERHGTAVAGVIAARGVGIAGVAPGSRLMALRACWQEPAGDTVCDSLSLAKALSFAIDHSAQVVNLSIAGPPDLLLGKLLDIAHARRIVTVAAFDAALPAGGFPASHPGVIAVADEAAGRAPAGVYAAPGEGVPTTTPGGQWALVNGSSFAAAHVSGLVALIRQRTPISPLRLATAPTGGAIDACATLLGPGHRCAAAPLREAAFDPGRRE